jgi:hypothetical protein
MVAPTSSLFNGFLGTFEELSVELAQYIDSLQKPNTDDLIQPSVEESLKNKDREGTLAVIAKHAPALNSAPEKSWYLDICREGSVLLTALCRHNTSLQPPLTFV